MLRRSLFTATVGALAASVPVIASGRAAGMSDVLRLRDGMAALTALDQSRGGHVALEKTALAGAAEAVRLQQNAVSQTVRQRLLSVAAHYTSTAAWSCIDARQLDRARVYLNEALRMAGMAQDPLAQLRVWNATAMLAHQRHEYGESIAASQAAQTSTAARAPLFSSLTHARTAIGHASRGDRHPALRSLGHAETALARADLTAPRPPWICFYGPAELAALSAIVHQLLGKHANAEAASHRALASLPKELRRNRSMTMVLLASAQLHQGEVDQACATTGDAFELMAGDPLPGRLRTMVGDFHRALFAVAPSAQVAREWADRYRTEWSTA
ncbi:hypothetical protein [Streptomyces sp. NPDC007369]|uniref:hypothetical protein n=1 Tax=Streptomyces sp. NPDC007369 TaxID=3154589 RepID=UPI0033CFA655